MGPRSFERGDLTDDLLPPITLTHPSMGPRSFERGDRSPSRTSSSDAALQWGRALSSAETGVGWRVVEDRMSPSMGPRSFERGDKRCAI